MIRLALAQHDFLVGDVEGNLAKAQALIQQAVAQSVDLVIFPEMALSGYPAEDLLLRPGFQRACKKAVQQLAASVHGIDVLIGHPWEESGKRYNSASWIRDGRVIGQYHKQCLPNYAVFDERRYFSAGSKPLVVELKGCHMGVIICEDAWEGSPAIQARDAGAELLLILNASPYRDDKLAARERLLEQRHADTGLPMVYCNLVGGQDELVFDGRSMLYGRDGQCSATGPLCTEALLLADYSPDSGCVQALDWAPAPQDPLDEIYRVLMVGLRDYVNKNGFSHVVFGLSGGIDSSLVLALAIDALGADHVHTVMMPSRHTSGLSIELAQQQAVKLGVDHRVISIEPAFEPLLTVLQPSFAGLEADVTEENLQARIRGNIVMALSNKFGWLPLATSNKSEAAVGYCTIYGDMCGGFAPLLDCFKTRVYDLARWRNQQGLVLPESPGFAANFPGTARGQLGQLNVDSGAAKAQTVAAGPDHQVIPEEVITRPPSAELRPNQADQDSLPPYEVLDQVLRHYVEQDWSIAQIVAAGFDEEMVRRVARLVLLNEYKRRQAAPGTRITNRAFGRDRRYPISSGWRE
ncbi:MAG TPA: NAD+ synthase [Xanthomonadales bacterium]|nr:NAD+ synthase [Xanthomonadales bacterium]